MRFMFLPATDNHGRATVCYEVHPDHTTDQVSGFAGITYSSPKDQFSRAVGKAKAQGRLRQGLSAGILRPRDNSTHFFRLNLSAYDDAAYDEGRAAKTAEQRFLDEVKKHVESFVTASVAKKNGRELG